MWQETNGCHITIVDTRHRTAGNLFAMRGTKSESRL